MHSHMSIHMVNEVDRDHGVSLAALRIPVLLMRFIIHAKTRIREELVLLLLSCLLYAVQTIPMRRGVSLKHAACLISQATADSPYQGYLFTKCNTSLYNFFQNFTMVTGVADRRDELCSQCSGLKLERFIACRDVRQFWMVPDQVAFDEPLTVTAESPYPLCRLLAQSVLARKGVLPSVVAALDFKDHRNTRTIADEISKSMCLSPFNGSGNPIIPLYNDAFRLGSQRFGYGRMLKPDRVDVGLIKAWLTDCETNHKLCASASRRKRDRLSLVTHLVDVKLMKVRGVSATERLRYLALSYVWGSVQPIELLRENRASFLQDGALETRWKAIPKAIQDAIILTKDLGEQYLWVDCLCICQDDPETKHDQISKMNEIYRAATMTFVALSTSDASGGLHGVTGYGKKRTQHLEQVNTLRLLVLHSDLEEAISASPWGFRAWTYQEELFSTRKLYLSESQAYFRCVQSSSREDIFEDDPNPEYAEEHQSLHPPASGHTPDAASAILYREWIQLVTNFSSRQYGYPTDRYNAFAGIESELRDSCSYPCVYGMPRNQLARSLCWRHVSSTTTVQLRVSEFPSWSWCGWTGSVFIDPDILQPAIRDFEINGCARSFSMNSIADRTAPNDQIEVLTTHDLITANINSTTEPNRKHESSSNKQISHRNSPSASNPQLVSTKLSFDAEYAYLRLEKSTRPGSRELAVCCGSQKISGVVFAGHLSDARLNALQGSRPEFILLATSSRLNHKPYAGRNSPQPKVDALSHRIVPSDIETVRAVNERYSRTLGQEPATIKYLGEVPIAKWPISLLAKYAIPFALIILEVGFISIGVIGFKSDKPWAQIVFYIFFMPTAIAIILAFKGVWKFNSTLLTKLTGPSRAKIFSSVSRQIPARQGDVVEESVQEDIAHIMLVAQCNDGYERVAMAEMVLSDWRASTPTQKCIQLI